MHQNTVPLIYKLFLAIYYQVILPNTRSTGVEAFWTELQIKKSLHIQQTSQDHNNC